MPKVSSILASQLGMQPLMSPILAQVQRWLMAAVSFKAEAGLQDEIERMPLWR